MSTTAAAAPFPTPQPHLPEPAAAQASSSSSSSAPLSATAQLHDRLAHQPYHYSASSSSPSSRASPSSDIVLGTTHKPAYLADTTATTSSSSSSGRTTTRRTQLEQPLDPDFTLPRLPELSSPAAGFRFPSVHLGSFDSLSQASTSPSPPPSTSGAPTSSSLSGTPASVSLPTPEDSSIVLQRPLSALKSTDSSDSLSRSTQQDLDDSEQQRRRDRAGANTLLSPTPSSLSDAPRLAPSPAGFAAAAAARVHPPPPPALGSPPVLSPISPLDTKSLTRLHLSTAFEDEGDDLDADATTPCPVVPLSTDRDGPLSWAAPPSLVSPGGGRSAIASFNSLSSRNSRHSILSPEPLSPISRASFDDLASPRLRDSPGVPRRRTIIDASHRVPPVIAAPVTLSPPPRLLDDNNRSLPRSSSADTDTPPSPSPTPKRLIAKKTSASSLTPTTSRQQAQPNNTAHQADRRAPGFSFPEPQRASVAGSAVSAATTDRQSYIDPAAASAAAEQDSSPGNKRRSLPRPPKTKSNDDNPISPTMNRQSQASETISMPMPMPLPVHSTQAPAAPRPSLSVSTSTSPKASMAALGLGADPPTSRKISRPSLQQERPLTDVSFSYDNNSPSGMLEPRTLQQQQKPSAVSNMPMPYTRSHQTTKSASNFPAIAGLADAGPYPTAQPLGGQRQQQQTAGARNGNALQPPQGFKPTEEVCLECMMRDRDLADVDATGPDAWERASAADFEDLKAREYELLRSMSLDHSTSAMSMEEASLESESISSPLSHTSALADERAALQQRKQAQRDVRRGRMDEQEQLIARVGWRGFKWEEGTSGEGFPRGFRGTKPGALTERGIKHVMTRFPSSSALRYEILQGYLRGQYRLIKEARQEAQRIGFYPVPEELTYPMSPTISSSEASGSHDLRRTTQMSVEQGAPSIKAPSISTARSAPVTMQQTPTLRPSPSTPALVNRSRPQTHYVPERERERERDLSVNSSARMSRPSFSNLSTAMPSPHARPRHLKGPSVSTRSIPKGRESRYYAGDDWSDTEDLWPPAAGAYEDMSPTSGGLRPFSFAVRAGAQGHDGRPGSVSSNHRRSIFGRFGDSVTSLFTSHGGSGSMMDMHLGLDMDRRNRTSSYQAHENPRVSMVSPGRPILQTRQSLGASVNMGGGGGGGGAESSTAPSPVEEPPLKFRDQRSRSGSNSRLTQVSMYYDQDESPKKKGGFKGLFQKIKKGGGKKDRNYSSSPPLNQDDPASSDLAPPPPMNFLVSRGEREHNRQRSSSSASFVYNEGQASPAGGMSSAPSPQLLNSPQLGTSPKLPHERSVSAPLAANSTGSDVSPTSSRFQPDGPRRRTGEQVAELPPGAAESGYFRRGSTMEMLTNSSSNSSPPLAIATDQTALVEEPQSMVREAGAGYRKNKQPSLSLSSRYSTSTSTVPALDTPDSVASGVYLSQQAQAHGGGGGGILLGSGSNGQLHGQLGSGDVSRQGSGGSGPLYGGQNGHGLGSGLPNGLGHASQHSGSGPQLASRDVSRHGSGSGIPQHGDAARHGSGSSIPQQANNPGHVPGHASQLSTGSITSPNRQKNLPPLPPGTLFAPGMGSPDMHSDTGERATSMYDRRLSANPDTPTMYRAGVPRSSEYFPTASPRFHQPALAPSSSQSSVGTSLQTPNVGQGQGQGHPLLQPGQYHPHSQQQQGPYPHLPHPQQQQQRQLQPRASFDYLSDARHAHAQAQAQAQAQARMSVAGGGMGMGPGMGMQQAEGRNAQSMYVNHPAAASTGSFGRYYAPGPGGAENGNGGYGAAMGMVNGNGMGMGYGAQAAGYGYEERERKERRRGIKSIFSKAR